MIERAVNELYWASVNVYKAFGKDFGYLPDETLELMDMDEWERANHYSFRQQFYLLIRLGEAIDAFERSGGEDEME